MEEKLPPLFVSIFKRRGIAYRKIGETFEKILSNLSEDEISSIEDIQRVLWDIQQVLLSNIRDKPAFERHGAIAYYSIEFLAIYTEAQDAAFAGFVSLANAMLRIALETILYGALFELLKYAGLRKRTKMLCRRYRNFIEPFLRDLGDETYDSSAKVLDVASAHKELKFSFGDVAEQLFDWKVINEDLKNRLNELYGELSRFVHRAYPNLTNVGLRVIRDLDWTQLEVDPELLKDFVTYCIEVGKLTRQLLESVFNFVSEIKST